jgi:hypothetical protein
MKQNHSRKAKLFYRQLRNPPQFIKPIRLLPHSQSTSLVLILSQTNPVHAPHSFLKIKFDIFLPSKPKHPDGLLDVPNKTLYHFIL